MTTQNNNPFVLPGLGQGGDLAQNPLLASMEMMRQAWQGMTGPGTLAQSSLATPMSLEDLERRIADLRTIENWLRMNLTMLSSSIQGLEVQRATIATLKSFIATPAAGDTSDAGPSPLEVALGIKPSGQAKIRPAAHDADGSAASAEGKEPDAQSATAGWWNMLQKQFDTLAAATTATMHGAEAVQAAAAEAAQAVQTNVAQGPASGSRTAKTAVKSTSSKAAVKTAAKAAPRKRTTPASRKTRT
ncbi:MAG TPA: PhaM family polyhydroxyalkanoate granule multifunctional regulatory protein [Eoetvoesiella sp.]